MGRGCAKGRDIQCMYRESKPTNQSIQPHEQQSNTKSRAKDNTTSAKRTTAKGGRTQTPAHHEETTAQNKYKRKQKKKRENENSRCSFPFLFPCLIPPLLRWLGFCGAE